MIGMVVVSNDLRFSSPPSYVTHTSQSSLNINDNMATSQIIGALTTAIVAAAKWFFFAFLTYLIFRAVRYVVKRLAKMIPDNMYFNDFQFKKFGIRLRYVRKDSELLSGLRSQIDVLKLENSALKKSNRFFSVLVALLLGIMILVLWGKGIVRFLTTVFSQKKEPTDKPPL